MGSRAAAALALGTMMTTIASAQSGPEPRLHKASAPAKLAAQAWPAQVQASYAITFNGLDVGNFEFGSTVNGQTYTLTGNARLSALLGAFQWTGTSRSFGVLAASAPRPSAYMFDFNGTGKAGSVKLGFAENRIVSVAAVPPHRDDGQTVPVREPHLANVLDPLTAVMHMARQGTQAASACDRRVPIFDGKQRFDLVLSYRRQEAVREAHPSGQPAVVIVCRIRYVPLAGHKVNDETRQMAANEGMEIAFRPIPVAGLLVPYRIVIPTAAGTATLTSQRINIVMPSRAQIALVH